MRFRLCLVGTIVLSILSFVTAYGEEQETSRPKTSANQKFGEFGNWTTIPYPKKGGEEISEFNVPPKKTATVSKSKREQSISSADVEVNSATEALVTASLTPSKEEVPPEVTSGAGTFVGKKIITGAGKAVIGFLGIPFAKPPLGDLRFKKSVPLDKLETPFYAFNLPNACYQGDTQVFPGFSGEKVWSPNTNVSEDCLYLNIWIPEQVFADKKKELVPTMMWIYGGAFFFGSASLDIYNGAVLASEENVIFVSSQYRLGPQGFLFLGTADAPGNMGMWDQNLALRWINDNIESFGGDPNAITLFGESCGGASVGYHLLSPQSKSYFKRGVIVSDLPGQEYSFVHPKLLLNTSMEFAKLAGCDIEKGSQEIMECLRNVDSATLTSLQWNFYKKTFDYPFVVTMDGTFLPDFPANLLANGDAKRTEILVGNVLDEASYFLLYKYPKYMHPTKPTSVSKDRFSVIMKEVFMDYSEPEQEAIISYYTNWKNPEDGFVNQLIISEAMGDAFFTCPMRKWADTWSNRGLKVYYFYLTHRPSASEWAKWMGVMHADDVYFYFGHPLNETDKYTKNEQILSANFMRLFANFAKIGNPSHKWERYTSEIPIYLDLNATVVSDVTVETNLGPKSDRCAFWNQILPMVNKRRRPPGSNQNPSRKYMNRNIDMNWNEMNAPPKTTRPQQAEEGLAGSQVQGQSCMIPMSVPTTKDYCRHFPQGLCWSEGFNTNTIPQYHDFRHPANCNLQTQQTCKPKLNY